MSSDGENVSSSAAPSILDASCPVVNARHEHVVMAHGGGGRLMTELIETVFFEAFSDEPRSPAEDQAVVTVSSQQIAITTDAFVVNPIFFRGGDLGSLAIHGTINDLAVGGAIPKYLTASFILEEGYPLSNLRQLAASMAKAASADNVRIVAGDTKVVERGNGDGVFITTTGVGVVDRPNELSVRHPKPGDKIIVSGPIGDHGVTIMSEREGIRFSAGELTSDSCSLLELTRSILSGPGVRWMRDATRGGVVAVLHEMHRATGFCARLIESKIPVRDEVHGACEMLGLDPLYVANEGKLIAVVSSEHAEDVLTRMHATPAGQGATVIGQVEDDLGAPLIIESLLGANRVVPLLSGEQLPRIC